MDVSTSTGLNGGTPLPAMTRAEVRAANKAAREAARTPTPAAPKQRAASVKKRKKRGTGARALATAAAKAEAARMAAAANPATPGTSVVIPIGSAAAGGHPLAIELASTLRTAGKAWTPERARAFVAAVNFALPTICGFPIGTALPLPKAA